MIAVPSSFGTEAAILDRVIKPHDGNLSATAARAFLKLDFDGRDRQKIYTKKAETAF